MGMHAIADRPRYTKIVVPLDGSSLSESALPVATTIVRASHGALYLTRVHAPLVTAVDVGVSVPDWDDEIRESEQAYLTEAARGLPTGEGIHVDAQLLDGPVGRSIKDFVAKVGAHLVVLTTHGRTGLSRSWMGSTADWLVRFMPVPVLLVRPPDERSQRELSLTHVLIALDGSDRAERVIADAIGLGRLVGARFTFVRIVQPMERRPAADDASALPDVQDDERTSLIMHRAKDYLGRIAESLRQEMGGMDLRTEVVASDRTAEAILDRARTDGADVIALSTRGRGASRLLVGSVADKILRGFTGTVLALGPAAVRELETDELVSEEESTAGWT